MTLDLGLQKEGEKALLRGSKMLAPAANRRSPGRSSRSTHATAQVLAIGSYPTFNPNRFAKPLTQREYEALEGSGWRAPAPLTDRAVNGDLSDGLDVQADHRHGGARSRRHHAHEGLGGGQCITVSHRAVLQRRARRLRRRRPRRSAEGLLGHLLLRSRRARQRPRRRDPEQGAGARASARRPGSTCRASRRHHPRRGVARQAERSAELRCEHAHVALAARSSAKSSPGASATTCTSPSARATC